MRVLVPSFFPKKSQRFDGGAIVDGKEDRGLLGVVLVGMPTPKWHDKRVTLLPIEPLITDPCGSAAPESMIDNGVGVAVGAAFFPRSDHLDLACHGRQSRSPG